MTDDFSLLIAPENLHEGSPEERASFGLLTIRLGSRILTEGFDSFIDNMRVGPMISAYPLAEWLAWNWWRLRWEPISKGSSYAFSHHMNTVGEGYVWPNITINTDGVRTCVLSAPSKNPRAKPFRYFGADPIFMPSTAFESAIDGFMAHVLERLNSVGLAGTNLHKMWDEITEERRDPEMRSRRRLEALMGLSPDEDECSVDALIESRNMFGESAVDELAAETRGGKRGSITAGNIVDLAAMGFITRPSMAASLNSDNFLMDNTAPAWRVGQKAAELLRMQESIADDALVSDKRISDMCGVSVDILSPSETYAKISFQLSTESGESRILLGSPIKVNRRFALARILGDQLLFASGNLHPATRSLTYRQKAQRAFAAELLAPTEAVLDRLDGEYTDDAISEVAGQFAVSTHVIETKLRIHGVISSEHGETIDDVA